MSEVKLQPYCLTMRTGRPSPMVRERSSEMINMCRLHQSRAPRREKAHLEFFRSKSKTSLIYKRYERNFWLRHYFLSLSRSPTDTLPQTPHCMRILGYHITQSTISRAANCFQENKDFSSKQKYFWIICWHGFRISQSFSFEVFCFVPSFFP